ncbi:hypothetical protein IAT40_000416 [Kwoniella sp. CBS 6097]
MPVFHPPLAHVSQIPITPDPSLPFVQISFYATFADDESLDGSWEIWTDLPNVDKEGNVTTQPGEWRAIAFEPYPHRSFAPQANGHRSDALVVEALKTYPTPPAPTRTLQFTVNVPADVGSEFAYTYRHINSSGETHWLGGLGGNGAIKLIKGNAEEGITQTVSSGNWSDRASSVNETQWYGVGIDWTGPRGSERPVIRTIPADVPVSPSILLLESLTPPHLSPLSKLVSIPASDISAPTSQILAIIDTKKAIDLASHASISAINGTSETAAYGLSHTASPRNAVQGALKAAKGHQDQDRLRIAEVRSSAGVPDDIAAFFSQTGKDKEDYANTYLIIYAPTLTVARDVSVILPHDAVDVVPSAVLGTTGSTFIPSSKEGAASRELALHLEAGPIAETLRIAQFVELRGAGSNDSIWICAPTASATEIGEEEIDTPSYNINNTEITPHEVIRPVSIVIDGPDATVPPPAMDRRQSSDAAHNAQEELQPKSLQPVQQPDTSTSPSWWLLRFISRVFANIWGLIIWPFQSRPAIESGSEGQAEGGENDEEARQISNPPTEQTPLLGSTSMSRDTSSSSTAFDPLASPASVTTAKGDAIVSKYHSLGSVTPLGTERNSPILDQAEVPVVNSVQIRSYAQMSFTHLPPFRFLLPPGAADAQSKLKISYRPKTGKEWSVVQPDVTADAGRCVELLINGIGDDKVAEWDVQVERT